MILAHLRKMQHGARLSRVMTANSVARWLRHMRLDDMDARRSAGSPDREAAPMSPIDTVLSRIEKPRANGAERWRSACPSCGGSIGRPVGRRRLERRGPDDVLEGLFDRGKSAPRSALKSPNCSRRRTLTRARRAAATCCRPVRRWKLLEDEANLVFVAAGNIAAGVALTPADLYRVAVAAGANLVPAKRGSNMSRAAAFVDAASHAKRRCQTASSSCVRPT